MPCIAPATRRGADFFSWGRGCWPQVPCSSFYTSRNFRLAREQNELNRRTLELTEQGQVTDRFTKAIEQLGASALEVRLDSISISISRRRETSLLLLFTRYRMLPGSSYWWPVGFPRWCQLLGSYLAAVHVL
jgi:hypothetical protein